MKYVLIIICVSALFLMPAAASAQTDEELKAQIEALKKQVAALEAKIENGDAKDDDDPEKAELEKRVTELEKKAANDKIDWGAEMRVRLDNLRWHINPYQQFMGMETPPVVVPAQDLENTAQYSIRLRLRMNADINENLKFMGRLSMYKLYGGSDVPIFNGFPNTVLDSFNGSRIPSNEVLRVERALLKWQVPRTPLNVAFGRMNSSDGPPLELREGTERQGTPMGIMVNAEVDGVHVDYDLHTLGLPEGTTIGFCGGIGYESGFGGGGQVSENYTLTPFGAGAINGMRDSRVAGFIYDMPLMFMLGETVNDARFMFGYNRFTNMTDIPYGALINFPIPGMYAQPSPQYVTATNNLGNMDQIGVTWQHKISDVLHYFFSYGYIKSDPNGKVSQYGFGGLLGDPDNSQNGWAAYTGLQVKPVDKVALGFEYNHGSERWFNYTPATGEPSEKLATRGNVYEVYGHWDFAKNLSLKTGYIHYDYSTAFSGWHIAPGNLDYYSLDNPNAVNFYPFPKTVKNFYFLVETHF
jgi:opacity protein-like surface antigen